MSDPLQAALIGAAVVGGLPIVAFVADVLVALAIDDDDPPPVEGTGLDEVGSRR